MKNWIKILTLAGFISAGLMAHSAASADFVQGQANTWLTTPDWWYVNISNATIPQLGNFTSINSITLTIDNTWNATQYGTVFLTVMGSQWWQTMCYTESANTPIPVGISDVTFSGFNCNHSAADMIAIGYPISFGILTNSDARGSWDRTTLKMAGWTGSCLIPGITTGMYGNQCPPILKFAINTGFAPPYSFTQPTNTNVPYYQPITFGGTCANNGSDQLSLTFGRTDGSVDNLASPTGTLEGDVYSGTYDIDCVNNTWTKTIGVSPSVVAAILVPNPGTTSFLNTVMQGLYVSADGRAPNFLSFDDVMTHSPEINDFEQWLLDVDADPASVSTSTKVCVNYGYQGSSTPFSQDCSFNFNPRTLGYPNTVQFPKETPLSMGNYFAIGYFDDANSATTYATTTEWDFSVVYSTSTKPSTTFPNGGTPASSANSANANGNNTYGNPNCNQGNIIVSGICSVAVYLLMPKNSDLTQFNGLFNNIKNKPPFGYFTAAQLAISGLATSTPAIMLAGISLLGVFFSPIRIGFTLLIYFLAGLFIFNRLRHFNFQS
jgi:hypothetical protein